MINKGYLTSGRDESSDECLTPRYAVEPIVKHLKNKNYKTIWCPFDTQDSFFVRVLRREGFIVIPSHIWGGYDFFSYEPEHYDCIVSNPPFSKKDDVLAHLYRLDKPFAVILPQNALQSLNRVELFMEKGLEFLGFNRRINYYINGQMDAWTSGNHFASAYFCRDVLPEKLMFEKITPIQEPYFSFEDMMK